MILDRSKVKLGHSIDDGALTVVEQIPGLVEYSDQTQALRRGTHWYLICCSLQGWSQVVVWGIHLSPCVCEPQVTGHPTTCPSIRRSTPWVVMRKCGRGTERSFPTISVPGPRSSVATRLTSRIWTLWSTSWGLMVRSYVSVPWCIKTNGLAFLLYVSLFNTMIHI